MSWAQSTFGRKNKMGSTAVYVDGKRFMSKLEARRYQQLKLLLEAGEIKGFVHQPRFPLIAGVTYVADFQIRWPDGKITVEDVKGFQTEVFKIKHKIFNHLYADQFGELVILTKKDIK